MARTNTPLRSWLGNRLIPRGLALKLIRQGNPTGGGLELVMELVEGSPLSSHIRQGGVPVATALR